jgi:transposase-like protein
MAVKQDAAKARYWQDLIREAARSGLSIREFCRRGRVTISQFYWWRRRLRKQQPAQPAGKRRRRGPEAASFVLVSEQGQSAEAGIELVLGDGRRLRIHKCVDEATLRAVLAALEQAAC